jgi:glucose/arabinose dehydrogenase
MRKAVKPGLAALALAIAAAAAGQQPPPIGAAPVTLASTPYVFDTAEQHRIKVTVVAKGLARPFAIEFLPNGDLLVSERGGGLRVIRAATTPGAALDPQPIEGMPKPPKDSPFSVGFQDMALAPDFATSHWLYFTYNEPAPRPAGEKDAPELYSFGKFTVMRGRLEGGKLTGVETLLQGDASAALGSRLAFAKDGTLFVTSGGAFGKTSQDLGTIYGKVLHLNADGSIPKDNPFVGSGRWGEIPGTGSLQRVVVNQSYGELRREALLSDLHQRVRDVVQGPDGNIYVLTDGPENAVLRIEPAP